MTNEITFTTDISIKVAGQELSEYMMTNLIEVVVDQHTHLPDMFVIRIYDPDLDILDSGLFDLTNGVEIQMETLADRDVTLMKGEITALEPEFGRGGAAELVVRGYDKSHRLYRQVRSRTFLNIKDSDLAGIIARAAGLVVAVDVTATVYEHIYQHNQTDLEFLRQRAWRIGYECFVSDETLVFRRPLPAPQAAVTVTWRQDLLSFSPRMSLSEQVNEVVVRGWDVEKQQTIIGKATEGELYPQLETPTNGADWAGAIGPGRVVVVDQPVVNQSEANHLAAARLNELSGTFVRAEGVAFRRPDIRAGEAIALAGLGQRFSGTYLVTNASHVYSAAAGLETTFVVQGTRTGLLVDEMTAGPALDRWFGLVTAVVTNNNDPKNLSRVKLKFPWLNENEESTWARVVSLGAGPETGFFIPPAVNDEVLVAFEHGDFNRPFVLGGLWSGKNQTMAAAGQAVDNGKTVLRTWRSPKGHHITMYESHTAEKLEVESAGGHTITLDDKGQKIRIKSQEGLVLEMDDSAKKIRIDGGHHVEVKAQTALTLDGGRSLTLTAASVQVDAKGKLDLKANGPVNVKGAVINLN